MPRPLRPIADGLIYHVINRGNGRQKVFLHDGDYLAFLEAAAELKQRKPFDLFGYCLMPNHFHLLLRPGAGQSVSRIMQSLLISHTQRYHRYHDTGGHVWQGRFKSPVIQGGDHLLCVLRYIEANPVRAKVVSRPGEYRWSSYSAHGLGHADDLGRTDDLIASLPEYDALAAYPAVRRRRWAAFVEQTPPEAELSAIRRSTATGLPLGERAWVGRLAKKLDLDLTIRPRGRPRKPAAKAQKDNR